MPIEIIYLMWAIVAIAASGICLAAWSNGASVVIKQKQEITRLRERILVLENNEKILRKNETILRNNESMLRDALKDRDALANG